MRRRQDSWRADQRMRAAMPKRPLWQHRACGTKVRGRDANGHLLRCVGLVFRADDLEALEHFELAGWT